MPNTVFNLGNTGVPATPYWYKDALARVQGYYPALDATKMTPASAQQALTTRQDLHRIDVDAEISRWLALALGWSAEDVRIERPEFWLDAPSCQVRENEEWRRFDYRDDVVMARVRTQYGVAPAAQIEGEYVGMWRVDLPEAWVVADTPNKAAALAVAGWNPLPAGETLSV